MVDRLSEDLRKVTSRRSDQPTESAAQAKRRRTITAEEFLAQKAALACGDCGHVGLNERLNPNNRGFQVLCPACGSRQPLGVPFLKQREPQTRRPLTRSGESLDDLWNAWGNRCAGWRTLSGGVGRIRPRPRAASCPAACGRWG